MSEHNLEKKLKPIFNPEGPDKEVTDELIEALSATANSKSFANNYAAQLIEAIKKGYEIQSGEEYKP
jgi:hypothetical protein